MTNSIDDKIYEILQLELGIALDSIKPHSDIVLDLNADSIDIVGITGAIETFYHIKVSQSEMTKIVTVQELIDYVNKKTTDR